MNDGKDIPPTAIVLMKMALGLVDAAGQRDTAVARHLNAAVEIAMGNLSRGVEQLPVSHDIVLTGSGDRRGMR